MQENARPEKLTRFKDFRNVSTADPYFLVLSPLIASLSACIAKYGKGAVLDIGCGNKPYKSLFDHCESYIGCDIGQSSENLVDIICDAAQIPSKASARIL